MVKLTISIVNYNGGQYLINCLDSIEKVANEAEITTIVVDNASSDDSIVRAQEQFPKVKFILNKDNLGFGKANNQVLSKLQTEYVLILNPDTVLEKGVLTEMLSMMEIDTQIGAATCKIILSNNRVDLTAHRGFPTPWASLLYFLGDDSLYHLSKKDMTKVHEVDSVSGAFLLTRKSVLDKVGLFDEDYFMFAEDIDLCLRIKQAGYKVVYNPNVAVLHNKGVSTGLKKHSQQLTTANIETRKRSINNFYETMKIFYKKHYEKKYPGLVNWLVYLGIDMRWKMAKKKQLV